MDGNGLAGMLFFVVIVLPIAMGLFLLVNVFRTILRVMHGERGALRRLIAQLIAIGVMITMYIMIMRG